MPGAQTAPRCFSPRGIGATAASPRAPASQAAAAVTHGRQSSADARAASPRGRPASPSRQLHTPRRSSPDHAHAGRCATPRGRSPGQRGTEAAGDSRVSAHANASSSVSSEARPPPPPSRWVGRAIAEWQRDPLRMVMYAGDRIPTLIVRFEAAVPQPPASQLRRSLRATLYRTSAADVDADANATALASNGASPARSKSPVPQMLRRGPAPRRTPPPADGEPVVLRHQDFPVPPVASSRFSLHELSLGTVELAGRFVVRLDFEAERIMTSKRTMLEVPPVDHVPLWFAIRPNVAVACHSKAWVLMPRRVGASSQNNCEATGPASNVSYWEHEFAAPGSLDDSLLSNLETSTLPGLKDATGQPLIVRAGEPVRIQVLTRDEHLNPSCRNSINCVVVKFHLVEPFGPEPMITRQRKVHLRGDVAPDGAAQTQGPGELASSEPCTGASEIQHESSLPPHISEGAQGVSGDVTNSPGATAPTRLDEALAIYRGRGVHTADFMRERAGRYSATVFLRGAPVNSVSGAHTIQVTVAHGAVHLPSCTCQPLPQSAVDPLAIEAAIERERVRATRERQKKGPSSPQKRPAADATMIASESVPACIPENCIGCVELVAKDRFQNRCVMSTHEWHVALLAQETWLPELEDDTPEYLGPQLAPEQPPPPPDGKAWIESRGDATYYVHYQGVAGRYLLHIKDSKGVDLAASPLAVLIVPPAGGPCSARLHGLGAKRASADEWSHFFLRPSEFIGCQPVPCDKSRHLFAQLRISIHRIDRPLSSGHAEERFAEAAHSPKQTSNVPGVVIEKHYGAGVREAKLEDAGKQRGRHLPTVEPGAHLVRYRVKAAGEYALHVRYGHTELTDSPFYLHVMPALLCVEQCRVIGLCQTRGEVHAGEEVSGAVVLADSHGNPVVPGPHVLDVPMSIIVEPVLQTLDPSSIEIHGEPRRIALAAKAGLLFDSQSQDGHDGSSVGASFAFSLRVAGWYNVSVWVADKRLLLPQGCYPLLVHPVQPEGSLSRVDSLPDMHQPLRAGTRVAVTATIRDRYGNVCAAGGHALRATLRAPSATLYSATALAYAPGCVPEQGLALCDRRDGTYEVRFTPHAIGSLDLTLSLCSGKQSVALGGGPAEFQVVPGHPSPEHCIARGEGTRGAREGVPAQFVVEARDAACNLVPGHDLSLRVLLNPSGNQQLLGVQADGAGRYTVSYTAQTSGLYRLSVLVAPFGAARPHDRRHVRGSPFSVPVHSSGSRDSHLPPARPVSLSQSRYIRARSASPSGRAMTSPRRVDARRSMSPRGRPSSPAMTHSSHGPITACNMVMEAMEDYMDAKIRPLNEIQAMQLEAEDMRRRFASLRESAATMPSE